jgi:hypothetical protein
MPAGHCQPTSFHFTTFARRRWPTGSCRDGCLGDRVTEGMDFCPCHNRTLAVQLRNRSQCLMTVWSSGSPARPPPPAAEMGMRAQLLIGLEHWLEKSRMTQAEAAKVLGVTQAHPRALRTGILGERLSSPSLPRSGPAACNHRQKSAPHRPPPRPCCSADLWGCAPSASITYRRRCLESTKFGSLRTS